MKNNITVPKGECEIISLSLTREEIKALLSLFPKEMNKSSSEYNSFLFDCNKLKEKLLRKI